LEKGAKHVPADLVASYLSDIIAKLSLDGAKEEEIAKELATHLSDSTRDHQLRGLAVEDAQKKAIEKLGDSHFVSCVPLHEKESIMTWTHLVIVIAVVILPVLITLYGKTFLGRAQKIVLTLALLLLLALDWAALSDITKASEASYGMEYAVLAASSAVFGFLVVRHTRGQTSH
jgi:amino acid transporter